MAKTYQSPSVMALVAKALLIFTAGDLFGYLFPLHAKVAFTAGLVLGAILQAFIPPKGDWKQTAVIAAIALVTGITRSFFG
jgi:hypothetical protein